MLRMTFPKIEKSVMESLKESKRKITKEIRSDISNLFRDLVDISPVYSGYYASNHGIIVRDSRGRFKTQGAPVLRPTNKIPWAKGLYVHQISKRKREELAKLKKFRLGDIVQFATRVHYSGFVEQEHGVYETIDRKRL